jgi:hypothetical protein
MTRHPDDIVTSTPACLRCARVERATCECAARRDAVVLVDVALRPDAAVWGPLGERPFAESVVLLPNPPRLTGEAMAAALASPVAGDDEPAQFYLSAVEDEQPEPSPDPRDAELAALRARLAAAERERDDHAAARKLLATDLVALANGTAVKTALASAVEQRLDDIRATLALTRRTKDTYRERRLADEARSVAAIQRADGLERAARALLASLVAAAVEGEVHACSRGGCDALATVAQDGALRPRCDAHAATSPGARDLAHAADVRALRAVLDDGAGAGGAGTAMTTERGDGR